VTTEIRAVHGEGQEIPFRQLLHQEGRAYSGLFAQEQPVVAVAVMP
jgi:hypothetical protein